MARRSDHRIVSAVAALALGACIVPDTNLKVQGDAVNPGTVRLLQSIAVTEEAPIEVRAYCQHNREGRFARCFQNLIDERPNSDQVIAGAIQLYTPPRAGRRLARWRGRRWPMRFANKRSMA